MSFNISMFVLYGKILFLKNRKIMKGNVGIIVCESNSGSIGLFFYKVKKSNMEATFGEKEISGIWRSVTSAL